MLASALAPLLLRFPSGCAMQQKQVSQDLDRPARIDCRTADGDLRVLWFVRSQPLMVFDWESGGQLIPLDLGVGRVFQIGRQHVNFFVEPFWNVSHDGPAPVYGITVGAALLYPDFWQGR